MTDSLNELLTENQSLYQKVQALTLENKRLREALLQIAEICQKYPKCNTSAEMLARKALEKTK